MIKALLTDIDNTILDFNKCELEALKPVLIKYGIPTTEENIKLYSSINLAHWKMLEKKEISREECITLRWTSFFSHFNINVNPKDINELYFNNLKNGGYLIKDAAIFLKEINTLGLPIYAVTNGATIVQKSRLEKSGILKYLKKVYISEEISLTKPDKAFFDYVLKDINLKNDEVIMLGDSLTSDIAGALNAKIVGQKAHTIASLAGVEVPEHTKILIGEVESVDISEEFAHEKLSPVLAMYRANDFDDALAKASQLINDGGLGHTSSLYIDTINGQDKIEKFYSTMKTCRVLINTPSSQGGIGDLYNFKLNPSLTLGCGSWGGNSVSENVGIKHLLNIKTVAERRENMLWFRTPEKVYIKRGCLPVALEELKNVMNKKKVFIVTDSFLFQNGYTKPITDKLDELGIEHTTFSNVAPDPNLACAIEGTRAMNEFKPDAIIAVGGGSAMDAGKIMWVMYEHPEVDFLDMAMRFMDIRKRVYTFPKMGEKAYFIAVPTSAGTGSEVTPFAVITDEKTGTKYPLADYELLPKMAIVDANMMMNAPKGLTSASGIDAVTHCLEAYASMMATEYTDGLAIEALKNIFKYLPRAYENGANDPEAREKMANAATMAGMAFANAFLGVCHSMAHKLGAYHHIAHGIANALMIDLVLRFNAAEVPEKMGTFPQYDHPHTLRRYAEVAEALGFGGANDQESLDNLIREIDILKEKIGIKKTIRDYGVDEQYFLEKLDEMSEQAFDDQCTGANPRLPLISEIKDMYLKAYYGGEQ